MEFELDLKELIRLLRKRLDILIALPLLALITSLVFSYFILTPVYTSSTTLIVNKTENANTNSTMDYNTVMANQQIAKTYLQIAKSRTVMEDTRKKLNLKLTTEEIDNMVSVDNVANTEMLQITVNDVDAKRAKVIANALADSFMDKIAQTMKIENVKIVDPAVENPEPIKPRKSFNSAIAFFLGLILSVGIILMISYLDNTIKNKEDIENLLDLPVIGTIPIFD